MSSDTVRWGLKRIALIIVATLLLIGPEEVGAFSFSGFTFDVNATALNGTNVTMEVYQFAPDGSLSLNASVSNLSNATGFFNVTGIPENQSLFYKPILRKFNGSRVTHTGQSLPPFPLFLLSTLGSVNFYLKEAATLNITAFNETGGPVSFQYQVKDTKLGYPVNENFTGFSQQVSVIVPADRNYSIMVYPNLAMPVSLDLNNISDYGPSPLINASFNLTERPKWVSGYMNFNGSRGFDELRVVPYLIEPGTLIFQSQPMPFNMSVFRAPFGTQGDFYNASDGFYNITLIGSAMGAEILLFVTAQNGSNHYGAFQNLTLTATSNDVTGLNLTLQTLLGNITNISMNNAANFSQKVNVTTKTRSFKLQNSSGATPNSAFVEFKVNYTSFYPSSKIFSWVLNLDNSANGTFSLPVISAAVKEVNIYSSDFAPKKTSLQAGELSADPVVINLTSFNPSGISEVFSDLAISMYTSNSTCNVPDPPSGCSLLSSEQNLSEFNPLKVILGGGKISFRMRKLSNNITVHYNDVDLLASGPPDALFDSNSSDTTVDGSLAEAWRFGSNGPEIYNSVILGFPYNESNLPDDSDFSIRIEVLYDEDWNVIWNISENTTAQLPSDYNAYLQERYNAYVNGSKPAMPCSKTNTTATCYVNTSRNIIWIQIPHFSGVGPTATATAAQAAETTSAGGNPPPITFVERRGIERIAATTEETVDLVKELSYLSYPFFVAPPALVGVLSSLNYLPAAEEDVEALSKELARPIRRVKGDPYEIASKEVLARYTWVKRVVITRGDLGVDSLAALTYARALGAPILLVKPGELPSPTERALSLLETRETVIVGGAEAVSEAVAQGLPSPIRIGGEDRYETAVKVAEALMEKRTVETVVVTDGHHPDLRAVILALYYQAPIVYVAGDEVPAPTEAFLREHRVGETGLRALLLVGVSDRVEGHVRNLAS